MFTNDAPVLTDQHPDELAGGEREDDTQHGEQGRQPDPVREAALEDG